VLFLGIISGISGLNAVRSQIRIKWNSGLANHVFSSFVAFASGAERANPNLFEKPESEARESNRQWSGRGR
jgi:hypothetical protein